jgi:uncharacterized protein YbjT (DUF2867 family)
VTRKILVTGAPGKVGTELVRLLATEPVEVRVLVHHIERSGEVSQPGVEIIEGDLADGARMQLALKDVDTLFLSSSASEHEVAVQTAGIRSAVAAGVDRIVNLSAYGAEAGSPVPFFDWHGQTEDNVRDAGVRWTLLRPYLYMQTLLQNVPSIHAQGAIFNCGEGGRIPFVDARDVAAAATKVLTSEGHDNMAYELTGPEALTWPDVADAFSVALDREVRYVPVPPEAMASALTDAGMPGWLVKGLVALIQFHRTDPGLVTGVLNALGVNQPRTLAGFLTDYAAAIAPARASATFGYWRQR